MLVSAHTLPDRAGLANQPLLPLKLTPPPLRVGVQLRPDLQALLSEARMQPLTLVVAPAGYGKTTLLSRWYQDLTRTGAPVAWLTLDTGDREPALFLAYLIRTFQSIFPDIGADAWRVLYSASNLERDWPLVAGVLCSDLQRKVPTAAFLFLDDMHLAVESAVIGQILGYILRAAPPTLHIIAAARRMPTFAPLARLRAEGRLLEITQRDLHLDVEEARQILAIQGVALNDDELALLLERTEGWALSVQFAARALAEQPATRRGEFVRALGGSQEQILSYLAAEVLADLSTEVIEFLQLAALPAHFDSQLLVDVLQRNDVPYLLQRAQGLGLPILPLDEQGRQLRFHPLWRELLLRGLSDSIDNETLVVLHRRFGRAFEASGELELALEHYVSAGADEDLGRAIRERGWPLLQSPRRDVLRRWLDHLPASMREENADLLYMWGYSQMIADPLQAAVAIERAADRYHQAGVFDRELQARSNLVALLFWRARPTEFIAIVLQALQTANRVRDPWSRGAALVCVTAILYSKGRYVAALKVARQASAQPLNPIWHWMLAMTVSTIAILLGRPNDVLTAVDGALRLPEVDHDDRLRQNLLRQRAKALYEQGQTTEAIAMALDAHRHLSDYYHDGTAGYSAAQVALLLTLQGRVDEAATYIAQARSAFHVVGALAPMARLHPLELYALAQRGQAARACIGVEGALRRLDEAEGNAPDLRLRLMLALVLGENGEQQRAIALLMPLTEQMRERGYRLYLAAAELYRAYLADQLNQHHLHSDALRIGWELIDADAQAYVPMLPAAALRFVAIIALREGITPATVSRVLRRQAPEQATEILLSLLNDPTPAVRERAAHLLGDLGTAMAFPSLRALLKDRSAAVRLAAEGALGRLVYRPPYTLRIRTLGAFQVLRGDQEVRDRDWRSTKARQLFQLLLTERGRMLSRDQVLDTLWPDMEPESSNNNMRVTINRLIKALEPDRPEGAPPSYLVQQSDTYGFNMASNCQLDAADFAAAVDQGQRAERQGQRQPAINAFKRAVALYGGPYLPDTLYEDWTVVERERLAMLFNEAALHLGAMLLHEGLTHDAIGLAWRVLENDRASEEAYQLLMRAHATLGERSMALRLYARCASVLREELSVEPLPETTALYNNLREMR